METKGAVNRYVCKRCRRATFTINLNTGVTPFGITCPHCQSTEAFSEFYRVGRAVYDLGKLDVTHCFYRPTKERLDELNRQEAEQMATDPRLAEYRAAGHEVPTGVWDQHVLMAGLVLGPLGTVGVLPEPADPPAKDNDFPGWQEFALKTYGRNVKTKRKNSEEGEGEGG